jgi:cytochrome P450
VGGSVTTTSTSAYALLNLLVHHPHVYKRLQQEVDSVVGDRLPSVFDRDSMPYTNATIHELMRYSTIIPTHMRINNEDTTIGGQEIPAGTPVISLACVMHRDEAFWGDPDVFRPERFLDDAGKVLPADHPRRRRLMAFGGGPRICVGEIFALRRLFIFIVSLAQAFDLSAGDKLVTCKWEDYNNGLILTQKPFTLRLTARQ